MITPEGDYLSNLPVVDCLSTFHHLTVRTMKHSMGHLVPSDWADRLSDDPEFGIYKQCGCWTTDERSILGACARPFLGKPFVDIGCHTGITSKTINWVTNSEVQCIDPMLAVPEFRRRFEQNTGFPREWAHGVTSAEMFYGCSPDARASGFCVDGDHQPGKPLEDAKNAAKHLADTGVIMFHDFIGQPVREAVTWLLDNGFRARIYQTPHMVACCWRGDFKPPDHIPDPRIHWTPHFLEMAKDFNFSRCE